MASLQQMLPELLSTLEPFAGQINVLVSDNCSDDGTLEFCHQILDARNPAIDIRYFRNEKNIGASKNLVSLFYRCETPYFMFLGDDDLVFGESLKEILGILQSYDKPSAIIQSFWNGTLRSGTGYVPYTKAFELFYEYGNAWAAVIDCKAAVRAIESRQLRPLVESIVWPQTLTGFLAIHDRRDQKVYLLDKAIGDNLVPNLNVTSKRYWLTSLEGLLIAAATFDQHTGTHLAGKAFVSHRTSGFTGHFRAIIRSSLVEKTGDSSLHTRQLLLKLFKFRGLPWSMLLWMCDRYLAVYWFAKLSAFFIEKKSFREFHEWLAGWEAKFYKEKQEALTSRAKRFNDWF